MLRVLTLSTLYPNAVRPTFGVFIEGQTSRLAARPDVDLRVVSPLGLAPFPFDRGAQHAALKTLPREEDWNGVRVLRPHFLAIPSIGWRFNPAFVEAAALRAVERLRSQGFVPDVIDAEFFFPDGIAAARLGKRLGIPVSIKARGSDIHYWGERPKVRAQLVEAADSADGLLAVSEAMKADMVALGMPAEKIRVHYTGVDLDRFRPQDRWEAKAKYGITGLLAVSVGNLIRLKGHEIAAGAVGKMKGLTLFVVGTGDDEMWIRRQAAATEEPRRIRFLGTVPHAEMPDLLAAADLLVHASAREGLANVWVEALACGTPVVASDVGSIREVIDRPEAGRIVSERSAGAFAGAIGRLLSQEPDPDAARRTAERFGWARNTETLYAHLAGIAGR
ncbi:glycosyltransferase [Sphingoaurantiacus capsulatus]|uniref:Glycosyltransferase n=1 Tax=Sphingoaurantiacus capsulatus TaxID=1771310 RepID=A0ABV7XFA2_9SPHN